LETAYGSPAHREELLLTVADCLARSLWPREE